MSLRFLLKGYTWMGELLEAKLSRYITGVNLAIHPFG